MAAPGPEEGQHGLHVAIIGAGITGVNLALGLLARNVSFTVYERAPGFREIGAGIGFSPNAERAMGALSPDVLTAFKRAANPNGEDYFQWIDGYKTDELFHKLYVGKDGFQGGLRSDILEAWAQLLPLDAVRFNKEIDTISDDQHILRLQFKDGTTSTASVVIGCDGIRSRVRQLLFPPSPTSPPTGAGYTSGYCFRALAPMPAAIAALGPVKPLTRFMYNGSGAHVITYPVGNNTLLNILAVLTDPTTSSPSSPATNPHPAWLPAGQHTAPGTRAEAETAFADWHPTVRRIIALMPERMDRWAIFDMAANPAPRYTGPEGSRVCVAGDAAHATGPHLGAGGGMGIEDALVLSELLKAVDGRAKKSDRRKEGDVARLVAAALEVYNEVRYGRTQEVVRSTRAACDLFQWRDPKIATDPARFGREITALFHAVWEYDLDGMVREASEKFEKQTADI